MALVAQVLKTVDPGAEGWLLIALGSLAPLPVGQMAKSRLWQSLVIARLEPRHAS